MKTIIALAVLAIALASPAFAAAKKHGQGGGSPLINGYTLQQWEAGAPSPGAE